jgi:hypothetical protein
MHAFPRSLSPYATVLRAADGRILSATSGLVAADFTRRNAATGTSRHIASTQRSSSSIHAECASLQCTR